jgi:hypothetical protein
MKTAYEPVTLLERAPSAFDYASSELSRLGDFLGRVSTEDYRVVSAHVRHALDHFDSLFRGAESGSINYDQRARDIATEADARVARARVIRCLNFLGRLIEGDLGTTAVEVKSLVAPDRYGTSVLSTLGRESLFVTTHLVHHLALIRVLLANSEIVFSADFGKALSTIAYEQGKQ